jgi:hypothetical protein
MPLDLKLPTTLEQYERAIAQFERHLKRAKDGTRFLTAKDGPSIGIDDPVVFAELKRSLEITNNLIRLHEIKPHEVTRYITSRDTLREQWADLVDQATRLGKVLARLVGEPTSS